MLKIGIFITSLLIISTAWAQSDSLVFDKDLVIVGEIKNLNRGVITIETDYSDSDFKIEWIKVREIYSSAEYIISLATAERTVGKLSTDSLNKSRVNIWSDGKLYSFDIHDVVYIKPVKEGFLQRLSASIDFGFTLTKTNNLKQFTTRSNLGYLTDSWSADVSFDAVRSTQDSIADVKRTDVSAGFNYFLGKNWFALINVNLLQNDEQKLKLRSTPKVGIGNYIIQTNAIYWGVYAGGAWNSEQYTDPTIANRKSVEANLGTELSLYDMGDISLLTNLSAYKSLTQGDRFRADFKFDIKYDLPLDFYIKLGYTHNFDSQPVEGASRNDYVFQTTFGWEL